MEFTGKCLFRFLATNERLPGEGIPFKSEDKVNLKKCKM